MAFFQMADIPGTVATHIAQRVVDRGIGEAYYLCCFNDIVADFEKENKNLKAKQESVQRLATQATNQTDNIAPDVKHWLEKAKSLTQEDTKAKSTCFFGRFPNCKRRYRRGKDLEKKTQDIKILVNECNNFKIFSFPSELPGVEYDSSNDFVEFEGRKLAYERLLKALEDGDNYVIGLQGIGGAGKTTLAIKVGKDVKRLKWFQHVIKVKVSNTPNIKNIQHEIASPLGLQFKEEPELDRAKMLWKRLTNGEKILIILDDVWEELNFKDIGIPSDDDHNNCYVLLTTRDRQICKSMKCRSSIVLEHLSEQDGWLLFQKCAGLGGDSPKNLKKKGQEIAKECKGLPIAIAAIASALKGEKRKKEWDLALRSFKSIDHNDEDLIKVYMRLKVSYDYVKDKETKELFLLCSVFPEDYEISVEDLTMYAIGLGLCNGLNSFEKARDHLHRAKKKLIDSCLLLRGKREECVNMHDLLRDLAHWMEKGKIKVILEPESNLNALQEEAITLRYLYYHVISDLPKSLDCPELVILILTHLDYETAINIPDTFFEGMKGLKVFTLQGNEYIRHEIPSLPKSIEVLKSLRTLTLRLLTLGDISIFEKLQGLESLRVEDCSINEVPSGIAQLKKLKLLSLKSCQIGKDPFEVMGQIVPQLEELYFIGNSHEQVDNEVITKFFNKNRTSPPLQRYQIDLVEKDGLMFSVNDSTSRALSISHFDASTSNTTIKDLIDRAEILHLHEIQGGYETIIPDFVKAMRDMNELIEIKLKSCSRIKFLIDTTKDCSSVGTVFSTVVNLNLEGMNQLKALCNGPPASDFLENLQGMEIDNCFQLKFTLFVGNLKLRRLRLLHVTSCPKLISLFTLPIAQNLELLEKLKIYSCEALKSTVIDKSEEKGKEIVENDHNQFGLFPKLEFLEIEKCPELEGLMSVGSNERRLLDVTASSESQASDSQLSHSFDTPQCPLRQSFFCSNIRRMTIEGCHKLTSLFTVSIVQTMPLEELHISSCDGLEHIIIDDSSDHDHKKYVSVLPKWSSLCVKGCNKLKYVVGQSHHEKHLSYQNIQIQIDFRAMESLYLEDLPNIISICQNSYHQKWFALKHFHLIDCPQFAITTVSDFMEYSDARQSDCLTRKDWEMITRHMHVLEGLRFTKSKIEGIFCLEGGGLSGQQVISGLKLLILKDLSGISYIFRGPKRMWNLQNLQGISLKGCGKLRVIFSTSLVRCLPQLKLLVVINCEALEQIVEEDEENQNISNPCFKEVCFPQLRWILVEKCSKLKRLFCMNTRNEFPKLKGLFIMEASDLEEVFGINDQCKREEATQDNVLPSLKVLMLLKLPSLANVWPYKLQTAEYRYMHNCPKLSLTSTARLLLLQIFIRQDALRIDNDYIWDGFVDILASIDGYKEHETDSESLLCSSQGLGNEELINEVCLVDNSQTDGETKGNPKQSTPQNIQNIAECQLIKDNDGETVGASVKEIANPSTTPLIIALQKESTSELVEGEPSNETMRMDQMALGKTKSAIHSGDSQNSTEGSVKEGSMPQMTKTITSSESERPSPDLFLVVSLDRNSSKGYLPQGFVEDGRKQTPPKDVIQEDSSTNEATERVGKPSDVAQKTSLQTIEESVQEGSISQTVEVVTSSESEKSTGDLSVASQYETSSQDFVEKGAKQPIFKDALQQHRRTIETSEGLEKPTDVTQKSSSRDQQTSIQNVEGSIRTDENVVQQASISHDLDMAISPPKTAHCGQLMTPSDPVVDHLSSISTPSASSPTSAHQGSELLIIEQIQEVDEADVAMAALESLLSEEDETLSTSISIKTKSDEPAPSHEASYKRQNEIKRAIQTLNTILQNDLEIVISDDQQHNSLQASLQILQGTTAAEVTIGLKSFVLNFQEQLASLSQKVKNCATAEHTLCELSIKKEELVRFSKNAAEIRRSLIERHNAAMDSVENNSKKIAELEEELRRLKDNQSDLEAVAKSANEDRVQFAKKVRDVLTELKTITSQVHEANIACKMAQTQKMEATRQWREFKSTFESKF